MNPWIAKNIIYNTIMTMRGEKINDYINSIREFNRLSYEEMREIQLRKLKQLLTFACNHNRFYRNKFIKNDIDPAHISSFADFARVPFLSKHDIKTNYKEMISEGYRKLTLRKTSGSTGIPLKLFKDVDSLAYMDAAMHDAYSWHAIKIGDKQARIWAIPPGIRNRLSIYLKDKLQNRIRLNSFDICQETCRKFYEKSKRFKPYYLYGLPSETIEYIGFLIKLGIDPASLGIKLMISTGEVLYDKQKSFLETSLACPVINEYGCTEAGIIAFTCIAGKLHLINHNILLEVIDPESGRLLDPGQIGEIVITELHNYSMPLIRYRLGDRGELSQNRCNCGLQSPIISHIYGRIEDMIITPEGKKVAAAVLFYDLTDGIQQFKAYQKDVDCLKVYIVPTNDFSDKTLDLLYQRWRHYLGVQMKIDVKLTNEIVYEENGKFRYFVSEISQLNNERMAKL